jgi:hypothetical protein
MKKHLLLPALLLICGTGIFSQATQKTFHSCRQVTEEILLTSPYVKSLVQPWDKKIKESGGLGWDHVLESSPVFNDQDPQSGNAFSADYIFLLRETYKDKAVPVYTFKIKPSNGKLYELDSASNMWIQRKSDTALAPIVQTLCK